MAASIFKAAWWPIHVAVAWVLTRNRAFVERSNRAGRSLRSIAVAIAMDKVGGKPTGRYFKGATDAWSALREEMAAGNVRASGTPFRRVADLEGGAVNTSGMAREIPAVEIASLRLQDDGNDKDCLVPEDWRVAHGSNRNNLRGYRNVTVFRDDVLRVFDAEGATPYVPDWERLPEAVKRVVATVVTEDQPKQAIQRATEDQVRFSIATEGGASASSGRDGARRTRLKSVRSLRAISIGQARPESRRALASTVPAARWHLEIEIARCSSPQFGSRNRSAGGRRNTIGMASKRGYRTTYLSMDPCKR